MLDKFKSLLGKKDEEIEDYYSPEDLHSEIRELPTQKELKELRKENIRLKKHFFETSCETLKLRRSIRKFSNKEIDEKVLFDIIESSMNAPAAGNIQNYKIILVKDQKRKDEIGKIALNQCWLSQAPVLLIIVRDDTPISRMYPHDANRYSLQNTASYIENVLVLTNAAGLGACWVEACENDVLKDFLDVPGSSEIDAIIPIGYPLEKPIISKENPQDLIRFETYSSKYR